MTYPDDVRKAAREAAIGAVNALHWGGLGVPETYRARTESGKNDHSAEVQSACIAIMAERQKRQVSDSAHWAACELMDAILRLGNGATIEDRTGLIEEHMEAHGVAREMAEREALLRRAESLIAAGKGLPFKPSFGMLVIEWMREIQKGSKQ